MWKYHSLLTHSPIAGQVGCFQFLAIMNKAAIIIQVQVLEGHNFLNQLGKYLGVQLRYHMLRLCLTS